MGEALPKHQPQRYSVLEYLTIEQESETKHEYIEGEITAMAGGTPVHSRIATNTSRALGNRLAFKKCTEYSSDLQIAVSYYKFVYPDVSVFCEPLRFYDNNKNAANNPTLIVEVLSESTENYDRSGKFMRYRQMESFREYVLIEQRYPLVEVFTKNEAQVWEYRAYEKLEDIVRLFSIDVEIPMTDIYLKVEFEPYEEPEPPTK